jgi:exopolysaccharide biosynthesis polyprenyl glycosylphosphotransferase
MKRIGIVSVDLLVIYACILIGFKIFGDSLSDYGHNREAFYLIAPIIGVLYLILMYAFGLYNAVRRKLGDVIYTVFLTSVFLMIGTMAACFFVRGGAMAFPRSVILISAGLYWIVLTLWRIVLLRITQQSHGLKTVTVIGPEAEELARILSEKHSDIYQVLHICGEEDVDLIQSIKECEIVFISACVTSRGRTKILLAVAQNGQGVYFVPEYRDVVIMSAAMQRTDDIPTFYISKMGLASEERFVKRVVDLILGTIGFIIFLPLGLITALIVKSDGGPLFYLQERLTLHGKVFNVIKFRTMVPNAEKLSGPVLAGENDPRITKAGRIMRAVRLDEIPQILNILRGDMSIVGPRPERPFFAEKFAAEIPQYYQRLTVKAGLTGLAQVDGKYNTTVENKLRYDLLYISNYSLFQDFLIILQTVKILFVKESTEGV